MARRGKLTAAKREREKALAERRVNKLAKRVSKQGRPVFAGGATGIDRDIADIVPGPQPPLWWQTE